MHAAWALVLALQAPPPAAPAPREALCALVVPLSFADREADPRGLEALLFERVAGLYRTWSSGRFRLWGAVREPLQSPLRRDAFREADLGAVLDAAEAREGRDVLPAFDCVVVVAAGPLGPRGSALWPRREVFRRGGRAVEVVLLAEDAGPRAAGIAAHELLHVLGLADKYDDPKADVGRFCLLGTGYNDLDPAPPCADCRARLGWTSFTDVDPRAVSEAAIPAGLDRAWRLPLAAAESLILERRGDVLLAWHAGGGRSIALAARLGPGGRLTPWSEPAFRPRSPGAGDVWVTDVRLDGALLRLRVAPEAAPTAEEAARKAAVGKRLGE